MQEVSLKLPDLLPDMSSDRDNILGVFNFSNIQQDQGAGKDDFFDMYVMLIDKNSLSLEQRQERVALFRKNEHLERGQKACCMNGGDLDLNKHMTGYGVIIKHFNGSYPYGSRRLWRSYVNWAYEGGFKGGYDKFSGFGRYGINNEIGEIAVGYFSGYQKLSGKAVVHTGKYIYSGRWSSNEDYNKQPGSTF